jgi:hypothetical protein
MENSVVQLLSRCSLAVSRVASSIVALEEKWCYFYGFHMQQWIQVLLNHMLIFPPVRVP